MTATDASIAAAQLGKRSYEKNKERLTSEYFRELVKKRKWRKVKVPLDKPASV